MAQKPDFEPKISLDPWANGETLRPEDWTDRPYIGKDGRDYHSLGALQEANRRWAACGILVPYKDKIILNINPYRGTLKIVTTSIKRSIIPSTKYPNSFS